LGIDYHYKRLLPWLQNIFFEKIGFLLIIN
jgi:hypothetical protein